MSTSTRLRALTLVGVLVAGGVSLAAAPRERVPPPLSVLGQPTERHAAHDHVHGQLDLTGTAAGEGVGSHVAVQAPGGTAVGHHAGGELVRSRNVARQAPRAELWPTGTQAAEPTLGLQQDGTLYYVGADYSAPETTHETGTPPRLEWPVMRSDDNGRTWTEVSPRLGPQRRHAVAGLDPMLHVDRQTGRVFTADLQLLACSTVSHSDDKGTTWTTSEACGLSDHQNVFTGPPVTSTTRGYPNIVYYCAIDGGALAAYGTATSCLKSLDGGLTWTRTGTPAYSDAYETARSYRMAGIDGHCGGATGMGVVDSNGTIYLPRGWCGQPWLAISKDEGLTWQRTQVADTGMPFNPDGEGVDEHEAAVGVDPDGNVYYTWAGKNRLTYLAISRDGGKTFGEAMSVGAPGVTETWGPQLAVGGTGKLAIAYVGSSDAPGGGAPSGSGKLYENARWNGYITMTDDALAKRPVFYSGSINDPVDALIIGSCSARCQHQFDFIDIEISPDGTPFTSMVDGYASTGKPYGPGAFDGRGIVGRMVDGPTLR
jgi:hypothetical protein